MKRKKYHYYPEYQKQYRLDHKEEIKKRLKKYYLKNKNKILKNKEMWRKNNPEKLRQQRIRINLNVKTNPQKRLSRRMTTAIYISLCGNKNGRKWESLVGYTAKQLKKHLEKLFQKGMTWDNYGKVWHIDHIIPKSKFNFTEPEHIDFKKCWALSNLRPLLVKENLIKHDKVEKNFQPSLLIKEV